MKLPESPIVARLMTAEEYMVLPSRMDARDELVEGMIEYISFGDFLQGLTSSRLCYLLTSYQRAHGGLATLRVGVITRRNPDTVRGPNLIYYTPAHDPALDDGYFETPADLIVEILGLSNPQSRLDQKVQEYLTMGCGMVWVVDPRKKTLTAHRHLDHAQQLQVNDTFDGGDLLPGLSFTIADLFVDQADSTAGLRPAARHESEEGRHDGCPY